MRRITTLLAIITVTLGMVFLPSLTPSQETPPTWEVYFSPHGGCTSAIIRELNKANNSILVQAYSFTSVPIAEALRDALNRGVKVEVILDKSQRTRKDSSVTFLFDAGIPTKINAKHAKAHSKFMVIDGEIVITGSFNFTKAAEKSNAENLLIIHDKELASFYTKNWQELAEHSEVYVGRGQ